MYGSGAEVGPELTGSDRRNLDYLLLNIVDPSAVVPNGFRATTIETSDGRTLSGLVVSENESTVTLLGTNTRDIIEKELIDRRQLTSLSHMPEGLLDDLPAEAIIDLLGYLRGDSQVNPDQIEPTSSVD